MTLDSAIRVIRGRAAAASGAQFSEDAIEAAARRLIGAAPAPARESTPAPEQSAEDRRLSALCSHATHTWGASKGSLEKTLY